MCIAAGPAVEVLGLSPTSASRPLSLLSSPPPPTPTRPFTHISVTMRCALSGACAPLSALQQLPEADFGCASADGVGMIAMLAQMPSGGGGGGGGSIVLSSTSSPSLCSPSEIASAIILRVSRHPVTPLYITTAPPFYC